MREKILTFIEKNSRINLKELAIMLGVDEASVANEIAAMEQENVICGYHTLIDWDKVTLEGKTLREVSQFVTDKLSTLDQVLSTKTNFILKKYKDHGTIMAAPVKSDERGIMS